MFGKSRARSPEILSSSAATLRRRLRRRHCVTQALATLRTDAPRHCPGINLLRHLGKSR
jgi:hypothetical protein